MATLETLARDYAAAHPKRDGGTWSGWCGSLMFRMCETYGNAPTGNVSSASTVMRRSNIISADAGAAPAGAFHFWDDGGDGHVGLDATGGGAYVFMATRALAESLGDAIGFNSVWGYNSAKPAMKYVGWSEQYADGDVSGFDVPTPPTPTPQPEPVSGELRQVQGDGVVYFEPIGDLAKRIGAALAARGRVEDPFVNDGDPGANWRKGVQRTLINAGLWSGEPDGLLGPNNLNGVQEYAKKFGDYTGPVDTDPQAYSWTGFALGLERP